jgi:hypothetical protein
MLKNTFGVQHALIAISLVGLSSCNDDKSPEPIRTKIDYTTLTAATSYETTFLDASNKSTVDFTNGNNRYKMFQALNTSIGASITAGAEINATTLKNMLSNTGAPFADASLNTSGVQLRNLVASSWPTADAEAVRTNFDLVFDQIALASKSSGKTAVKGQAGKLGTRLVDARGIELIQIIQKSLIGSLQYDYIANVVLTKGLDADNRTMVSGKNYTQLEQNWDEAYGLLTLNKIYLQNATASSSGEFALGSYAWEYGYDKVAQPTLYLAFLKGRAAIANNDLTELKKQADFIKSFLEKAIAKAAVGYMGKANSGAVDANAHALAEGLGFVYSLRFMNVNGGDTAFSDGLLAGLVGSEGGFWDLTQAKLTTASNAITAKFKLQ